MQNLGLVLYVFGFVFFCIAGFRKDIDRAQLIALGLACCAAAVIFGGVAKLFGN